MAVTLTSNVSASIGWTYTSALTGSHNIVDSNSWSFTKSLTSGTGSAGTADLIYHSQGTISASGTQNFDFAGSLTDVFGTTITMARIKYIFLHHTTDTTATSLTVGNHAAPIAIFSAGTTTCSIRNGGILLFGCSDATGIAVGAGSTDGLKVLNADGSNTATYQIAVIGSSA